MGVPICAAGVLRAGVVLVNQADVKIEPFQRLHMTLLDRPDKTRVLADIHIVEWMPLLQGARIEEGAA